MQAWDKALAETGVNPFPMNRISTALVLHVESGQQGLSSTFLGDSTGSAKSMAEKIIHRLENPLTPAANPDFAGQELIFYKKFLEFLGNEFLIWKKTNKAQRIKGNRQGQAGSLVPYQCGEIATDAFWGRGGGIIRKMKCPERWCKKRACDIGETGSARTC